MKRLTIATFIAAEACAAITLLYLGWVTYRQQAQIETLQRTVAAMSINQTDYQVSR